jgi:hypothetical protein
MVSPSERSSTHHDHYTMAGTDDQLEIGRQLVYNVTDTTLAHGESG